MAFAGVSEGGGVRVRSVGGRVGVGRGVWRVRRWAGLARARGGCERVRVVSDRVMAHSGWGEG